MSRLLNGFKDPVKRPRFIIWTGVIVLLLAVFVIVALGVTSTYWFCSSVCHTVQDDSISQYNRSTHAKVSCMACHMPVNTDPVTYVLHKAKALGELYLTATEKYELPLNKAYGNDHLAMNGFATSHCTQCHALENRDVTPSPGIIIDHKAHSDAGIRCTWCHNRIAHDAKGYTYVVMDPATGEVPVPQPDYMTMSACFRCHSLDEGAKVTGDCAACHPSDFELKPPSHFEAAFMGDHGKMSLAETERVASATAALADYHPDSHGHPAGDATDVYPTPEKSLGEINLCSTCHTQQFCSDCHGMEMPHPADFKSKHGDASRTLTEKCVMCHGNYEETKFCDSCHHGTQVGWSYTPDTAWTSQHAPAVVETGVSACLGACHTRDYCLDCHTSTGAYPTSHRAGDWTRPATPAMTSFGKTAAVATAAHTVSANSAIDSCGVCHGDGGIEATFCTSCHKTPVPHSADFKKFHSETGRTNAAACRNCHGFNELCSNCHHVGSSLSASWASIHGAATNENGSSTCLGSCHQQSFCVDCHQTRNVLPASHKTAKFVRDFEGAAEHTTQFKSAATTCILCHAGDAATLASSAFCQGCHSVAMPHTYGAGNQKFAHAAEFRSGTYAKTTCQNCHQQRMCDSCHHVKSDGQTPWTTQQHKQVVLDSGAVQCFECHQPTFCSACHIRIGQSRR